MTIYFNENLPSSKYQSDSMIQRTSKRTKGRRDETSRDT